MITFLHLKMGKSLHESETSNDNDIVYGVLVEILLELIIQNRAKEKKRTFVKRTQNSNPHHPQYSKHIFVHELVCDFMSKNIAFNEFNFISNIHLKCKTAQQLIRSNASSDDFKMKKRF